MKPLSALFVLFSFILSPILLAAQDSSDGARLPPTKAIMTLIEKAQAADTQKGLEEYSKYLTRMMVYDWVSDQYTGELAHRLDTAELATRQGKRKFIPEDSVVQAFNELMKKVGNSSARPISTTIPMVHQLRVSVRNTSSVLSSLDSHNSDCLPSEAAFLIYLLIADDGTFGSAGNAQPGVSVVVKSHSAASDLATYEASHSPIQIIKLYYQIVGIIGV